MNLSGQPDQTIMLQQSRAVIVPASMYPQQLTPERRMLHNQLAWLDAAARDEIHRTKEAAAEKMKTTLENYRTEFHSAVTELRRQSDLESQAMQLRAVADSQEQKTEAILAYTSAECQVQRFRHEMGVMGNLESDAAVQSQEAAEALRTCQAAIEDLKQEKHGSDIASNRSATCSLSQMI